MLPLTRYSVTDIWTPEVGVRRSGERQARPYNLICEMEHFRAWINSGFNTVTGERGDCRPTFEPYAQYAGDSNCYAKATNLAYKRLVDQLGDSASLGATLTAERRETFSMLTTLLIKGVTAARQIRKFRFAEAARTLGIPYRERTVKKRYRVRQPNGRKRTITVKRQEFSLPNGRTVAKTAASGWLLFSYGIKPLMSDCHAAAESLVSPFPWMRIRGRGRAQTSKTHRYDQGTSYSSWHTFGLEYKVTQGVDIRISNPNTYLANRLGLVNPAQWALEAIPLSFVVDWASNLSDVVMSMTDFVGLELSRACVNTVEIRHQVQEGPFYPGRQGSDWTQKWNRRSRELRLPTLVFAYERFQWQRAANAISLLVGFLPTRKSK